MSARIFFAGATVGAIVGALAVLALQTEKASSPIVENPPTAAVPRETPARPDAAPPRTAANVVQSTADRSAPAVPRPERTVDVAPASSDPGLPGPGTAANVAAASSSDPGDEVLRSYAEERARGESIDQTAEKMRTEARDDAWASNMENELRDYLARRPVPNGLGSVSVECRTTVCRVLSVVSDEIVWAVPMTDLQAAMGHLPDESLGRELVVLNIAVIADSKHPGQMIEAAFLRRADKPSNARR